MSEGRPGLASALVRVGSLRISRGILEPGLRWPTSLKPIQGTPSSQIHHSQLLVQGQFPDEMDDVADARRSQPPVRLTPAVDVGIRDLAVDT